MWHCPLKVPLLSFCCCPVSVGSPLVLCQFVRLFASMSVSIGDAITLTEIIFKIYKAYSDAPKEVSRIYDRARNIGIQLGSLRDTLEKSTSSAYTKQEGMQVFHA